MPRVAFTTLGCKVNQYETEVMQGLFKQGGYDIVDFDETADVYVINTCSVTHLGEKKSRQLIRRANRRNNQAVVVVTGCYSQVNPEQVAAIDGVDVIIGTRERLRILELVEQALKSQQKINVVGNIMHATEFEDIPLSDAPGRTRAFIKIQEGCTNFCTYCIIPFTRGPLRSRLLDSIRCEAEKLIAAGFKELVLTGIHLGAYGRDLAGDIVLIDAVKTVLDVEGVLRLRLSSLESIEVSQELLELIKYDPRMCHHLHLPLQAGHDDILKSMNRHYTVAEFEKLVQYIRAYIPDIAISTDLIVGFPGETNIMFEKAWLAIRNIAFAKMHIFPYSRRKGTPAANYENQITEHEKKRRVQLMQQLGDEMSEDFNAQYINKTMEVLFEANHKGVLNGLTGNYIRVYAAGHDGLIGEIKPVRLIKKYKEGLFGIIED